MFPTTCVHNSEQTRNKYSLLLHEVYKMYRMKPYRTKSCCFESCRVVHFLHAHKNILFSAEGMYDRMAFEIWLAAREVLIAVLVTT